MFEYETIWAPASSFKEFKLIGKQFNYTQWENNIQWLKKKKQKST